MVTTKLLAYRLPKAGNLTEECEDAFFVSKHPEKSNGILRVAVADGATEALLSGQWAQILTSVYARLGAGDIDSVLARALEDWTKWSTSYVRLRNRKGNPIQWYEEPGLEAGAFATLLGVDLKTESIGDALSWQALAIGDSCLFLVRKDALCTSFPQTRSEDFSNNPWLIGSNPSKNTALQAKINTTKGELHLGDELYLMTDALAAWFLRRVEEGKKPWTILEQFGATGREDRFSTWIGELRAKKEIKNDDVTLVILELDETSQIG